MKATQDWIAGPFQSAVIAGLLVWMPILWWAPLRAVTLSAIPVWVALVVIAAITRNKKENASVWLHASLAVAVYLCYAVAAFYLRR